MVKRERSVSTAMRRLSRPISVILSEFTRKPTDMFLGGTGGADAFDPKAVLKLDFEQSKPHDFDFEGIEGAVKTHDDVDDTQSLPTSPSTSSRLSGSSWTIKKDHAIYIYHDDACMSSKEAYNPFASL